MKIKYFLLALALMLPPTLVSATITTATGTTQSAPTNGIVWTYTLNPDGTATINQGNVGAVVSEDITLPDAVDGHAVTGIAFYTLDNKGTANIDDDDTNWKNTTSIVFPATLTSIGEYVFCNAANLTTVTFNNQDGWASLRHIGEGAFDMTLSKGGNGKFVVTGGLDLSGLTDTTIHTSIFKWCTGIQGPVKLPANTEVIDGTPFANVRVTSVNFDELTKLNSIGPWAFFFDVTPVGATLSEVDLSNCMSLVNIQLCAFGNNPNLTTLKLPASPSLTIDSQAFSNCDLRGDLVIPSTTTSIGYQAFQSNPSLRSVAFTGMSLDMSGYQVFFGCNSLEYIDMGSTPATSITSLARAGGSTAAGYAFSGLPAHTVVYLPSGTSTSLVTSAAPNNMNYVLNGTCPWFYVQDGCDYYIPHSFTAASATWNAAGTGAETTPLGGRAFTKGTVSTAYLPFPFRLSDPTSLRGYELKNKKNSPVEVFRFTQHDPTIRFESNTPYLIRYLGGANNLVSAAGVTVPATSDYVGRISYDIDPVNGAYDGTTAVQAHPTTITDPGTGAPWGLYGTTERVTNALASSLGWDAWILNSNKWYSLGSQDITPMRAFLHSTDPTATARPSIELTDLDGSTTGIVSLDDEPANSVETRIYNLNGQFLGKDIDTLPKGLYIVNGGKQIKK